MEKTSCLTALSALIFGAKIIICKPKAGDATQWLFLSPRGRAKVLLVSNYAACNPTSVTSRTRFPALIPSAILVTGLLHGLALDSWFFPARELANTVLRNLDSDCQVLVLVPSPQQEVRQLASLCLSVLIFKMILESL